MLRIVKLIWKGFSLLSIVTFTVLFLYMMFKGHDGVNKEAYDNALMFFFGVSLNSLITFSHNVYQYSKNSAIAQEIRNTIHDSKLKKLDKAKIKEELKELTNDTPNP